MSNGQKPKNKDGKTRYTKAQLEAWKREMESRGDTNSTYFYQDNDQ